MRSIVRACVLGLGVWSAAAAAFAQAPLSEKSVGVTAQSAFGNVTSQAFGLEAGFSVAPSIDVFLEAGRTVDAAPATTGQGAQVIAGTLAATQANVAFTVAVPIDFIAAGAKYRLHFGGKLQPYVLAGGGVGIVKPKVDFTIGGVSVNNRLDQFGVVLGSDLSGTSTKFMIVAGAGARYALGTHFYADAEFRYNRVFVPGGNIPFTRVGAGLGVRF
jgi:opacity protein-like surface antigen